MTLKQVDHERRILRAAVAKTYEDIVAEANLATEHRVVVSLWKLAGRLEGIMKQFSIEREMAGKPAARRNP